MKKIIKFLKSLLVLLLMLALSYLFFPTYLKNALSNLFPKIYDYQIFENNEVINNGNFQEWALSQRYNQDNLLMKYDSIFQEYETVAYLVIQNDSIIHESYWDEGGKESISGSFSAAKTVVAMLIGCAIDDGYINSVDDGVGLYLDDYSQGENSSITIKDLLTMSSGLNWHEAYSSPFSVTTQAYYGEDLWSLVKDLKLVEQSGTEFKYLSGNTQVLGFILKQVTGKSLAEYASEKIWSKIGAKTIAKWSVDKQGGMEKAYCCFNTSARDYARFGKLILNKGDWNGEQIISKNYMTQLQSPAAYLINPKDGELVDFYGYQTWIMNHKGLKIPYMRGILGQYVFAIPEKNAIVVRLGKKRSDEKVGMHRRDAIEYVDIALELLK